MTIKYGDIFTNKVKNLHKVLNFLIGCYNI